MTDYDGISALIPKIANKAIEWRMVYIEQWSGDAEHGFTKFGLGASYSVDAQGHTMMNGESTPDQYYVDYFRGWRDTVEEVLRPWTELPDPTYLDSYISTLEAQAQELLNPEDIDSSDIDPGDGETAGNIAAGGDLHAALQTIDTKLGNMTGYTAAQMYEVLVSKLGDVVRAEFAAVGVLGIHLEAQKRILDKARKDAAKLFDAIYNVMDNFGLVGDAIPLSTIGALLGIGGAFGGPAAPAFGAAGAVVGLADALLPDPPAPDPVEVSLAGYDPDESWELMTEALNKLSTSVNNQEADLCTRLANARTVVAGTPAFDLSKIGGTGSDPGKLDGGDVINIDKGGLEYIAENSLPVANGDLVQISSGIEGVDPGWAMQRPISIGYTDRGIYPTWHYLRDELATAIDGTAAELNELRAAVIKVLADFDVTDIDNSNVYHEMNEQVAPSYYRPPGGGRVYAI